MKRFFTILAALVLFSVAASAQLDIQGKELTTETLSTARFGNMRLVHSSDDWYYMVLASNNQFEDSELFVLGKDYDSALKTMQDIGNLFDTLKGSVTVKDAAGTEVLLTKKGPNIFFRYEVQAGQRWLSKGEMQKFLTALLVLAEETK